jgi:hypothetical protein
MAWIGVGAAVLGAGASVYGANKQAKGAQNAAGINMDMFNVLNRQQQPFIQGGYGAMGRLNTLLGLNPNPNAPRMSTPLTMPDSPGYRITPGGGIDQMVQAGPVHDIQIPERGPTARLSQLLMVRAANGDRQAQAILRGGV